MIKYNNIDFHTLQIIWECHESPYINHYTSLLLLEYMVIKPQEDNRSVSPDKSWAILYEQCLTLNREPLEQGGTCMYECTIWKLTTMFIVSISFCEIFISNLIHVQSLIFYSKYEPPFALGWLQFRAFLDPQTS